MSDLAAPAFARTKIQPPRPRADLVSRPRLEQALGQALSSRRLTLLLAPAGWGKTSALARQLSQQPAHTALAWVTADEDDDLPRLLAALGAALEPLDLPWRVAPAALGTLSEDARGIRLVADEMVNTLADAACRRGLLVLDDLHRIADPRVHEFLAALAERLPERWGLVLASRTEPALPLARWRARGELAEIGQSVLRFEPDEVQALLVAQGADAAQAGTLLRRTEGWAAGLRLLLSAPGSSAAASTRLHVFDFLADEVLAGMAGPLRLFLLRCAVLPELSPARCAHVSAMPEALQLFDQVERAGLFVTPLDAAGRTLRLHDLFRDFLEDRLQRDHAAEIPALLQRAAEHEPDLARAVGWLVRAGAWDRAASVLAERGPALVPRGGAAGIERLLDLFPPAELARHPELEALRGLCAYHAFEFERVVSAMQSAAAGFERAGQTDLAAWARLMQHIGELSSGRHAQARAGIAALRQAGHAGATGALVGHFSAWAAYSERRVAEVAGCLDQALAQLEALADPVAWQLMYFLGLLAGLPGMAPVLQRYLRSAAPVAGTQASLLRVGVLHARAALALRQGAIVEARDWLGSADEDLQWLGRPRSLLTENLMLHLVVDALHGDHAACAEAAAQLRADLQASSVANRRTHGCPILMTELRAAWALGDTDWVRRVALEAAQPADPYAWDFAPIEQQRAAGLLALLDGRNEEAAQDLMPPPGPLEFTPLCGGGMMLMLCAEAQRRLGRLDAAAALLQRWWTEVDDEGQPPGAALLAGSEVLAALAAAPWKLHQAAAQPQRLQQLLRLAQRDGAGPAQVAGDAGGIEARRRHAAGLTEREAQVLDLMAQGQSNKLIARALDLSPYTVKRHVANILNKTGTDTRTEVAAWWLAQRG